MSVAPPAWARRQRLPRSVLAVAALLAIASGPLALLPPALVLTAVAAGLTMVLVAVFPRYAAYVLLATTPLIVGIDRGAVLPLVRPSEIVAGLVAAGLGLRGLFEIARGAALRVRPAPLDLAIAAFAISGSVLPLLWMVARGKAIAQDDLVYAMQPWKFVAVFLIVRFSVRTEREVRRCLQIVLATACLVGLIAILQSLQLMGVEDFLVTYYTTDQDPSGLAVNRGDSTLLSSLAVGDFMTYSLAIAVAWLTRGGGSRRVLLPICALCVVGAVASGQYSGFLAIAVAVLALGVITGNLQRFVVASLCVLPLVVGVMWPVIANRLSGFQRVEGLPQSWSGRWRNLNEIFWPQLDHFNWVLGVRPAARVPAPDAWRDWIWIESGHTWLLWAGGVPFLVAFFVLIWCGFRHTAVTARRRTDAIGVASTASFAALSVVTVLMTLDPHVTTRGSADLLFSLLGLSLVGHGAEAAEAPNPSG